MKKIIPILGILLLLASCSNPKDLEKIEELNNKNKELQQKLNDDLFEKNKECGLLKDKIQKEIFDQQYVYKTLSPQIKEIFYSSKRNSCLYVFSYKKIECENLTSDEEQFFKLKCINNDSQLVDFYTKEMLEEQSGYTFAQVIECYKYEKEKNENYFNDCNKLNNFELKISKYK